MRLLLESSLCFIISLSFPIISLAFVGLTTSVHQKYLKHIICSCIESNPAWNSNLSQEGFMLNDRCILVSENDEVIGSSNKLEAHVFDSKNPNGLLHRAFSVFLFNTKGELLLQQRAAHKKTFPDVWTNTCCSHPLFDMLPTEIDTLQDIKSGKVPGTCNAILRKLDQELGIDAKDNQLTLENFKFLTRIHYCAKDASSRYTTSTSIATDDDNNLSMSDDLGAATAYYGEQEIDYILFLQKDVLCEPNPEEIQAIKYVTLVQLQDMLKDPSLKWSPWFRIIVDKFLIFWWADLTRTLNTDSFHDYHTIHRF